MTNLFFQESGSGQPVILLHGFPFHHGIWGKFAQRLSASCHVYTVDLPGFGKSPILKTPFTLDQIGESIVTWVFGMNLQKPVLIGHSLGGYVALAAIKKDPGLFSSLGLFHSTAYADTEEKKQSRNKVIEFIEKNGVEAFTSNFIDPLFVDPNHPAISKVKSVAMSATEEAVKNYTIAMRDRTERTEVLRSYPAPVLFLAGEKDPGISVESIKKQAALRVRPAVRIVPNIAHMGMFENETECLNVIQTFIQTSTVTNASGTV